MYINLYSVELFTRLGQYYIYWTTYQSPNLHLLMNVSILAIFEDFLKYLFILILIR